MKDTFFEKQKFNQWWLWIVFIFIGCFTVYGLYQQLFLEQPVGDNPMSNSGLIIFSLFILTVLVLFFSMHLTTKITEKEITIIFFPFVKKTILWSNVSKSQIVNYGFVGGWGIRIGTKFGTVYNIKGNVGLALELINGKKLLIGTQKKEELAQFLKHISNLETTNYEA